MSVWRRNRVSSGLLVPSWFRNSALSLILSISPRAAVVLVFIAIGRWSGPSEAGVFSVASAYSGIAIAAARGLDDLLTRRVASEQLGEHVAVNGLVGMKLLVAMLGVLIVFMLVAVLGYPEEAARSIRIMALAVVPDTFSAAVYAYYQGRRRFVFPSVVTTMVSIIRLVMAVLLLRLGAGIRDVAWVWTISAFVGGGVAWFAMRRHFDWLFTLEFRSKHLVDLRQSLAFLGITLALALEAYVDVILLDRLASESAVGWYRAATNIVFTLAVIPQAYQVGVYPSMVALRYGAEKRLRRLYEGSIGLLGAVVLPAITLIGVLAPEIISAIFGEGFGPAVLVLRVLIISLVFIYLNAPVSRMMLVYDREEAILLFLLISLLVNLGGNLLFDPLLGARGAALSRVCSTACFLLLNGWLLTRVVGPPRVAAWLAGSAVASVAMAAMLWFARRYTLIPRTMLGLITFGIVYASIGRVVPAYGCRSLRSTLSTDGLAGPRDDTSEDNP